jgi:O-antigen/teichoic acid export membrane protein
VLTWSFFVVILLLSVATFVSSQWLEALHALGHSAEATRVDALGAVVSLALLTVLVGLGPGRALLVMLCCYLMGYAFRIAYSAFKIHRLAVRDPARVGGRRLLRRGVSFLGFNVGQVIAFRADRYLLGPLASPAAVGIYSVAATPAEMLRLPVTALSQLLMQRSAAAHLSLCAVRRACLLTAAITIPPALALFALADVVIRGLFGERYADAAGVLRIMVCSEVLVCFFILLSRIAAGAGLARATGVSTALGAAAGLVTLLWWAPQYGAIGAAWASFAAYTVMLATCIPPVLCRAASGGRTTSLESNATASTPGMEAKDAP